MLITFGDACTCTVKPHYYGHTPDHRKISVLIKGSVLISGVVLYIHLYVAGTVDNVLIKGGVLISGVVLYASLCSWDSGQCPD